MFAITVGLGHRVYSLLVLWFRFNFVYNRGLPPLCDLFL